MFLCSLPYLLKPIISGIIRAEYRPIISGIKDVTVAQPVISPLKPDESDK